MPRLIILIAGQDVQIVGLSRSHSCYKEYIRSIAVGYPGSFTKVSVRISCLPLTYKQNIISEQIEYDNITELQNCRSCVAKSVVIQVSGHPLCFYEDRKLSDIGLYKDQKTSIQIKSFTKYNPRLDCFYIM